MDWVTTPHPLDPDIARAADHLAQLLPVERGVPIIDARDVELSGFNLADVLSEWKASHV